MPATLAPFGLRAVQAPPAITRTQRAYDNAIPSGYGTSIFKNTPVTWLTTGFIAPLLGTGTGTGILGSFVGCEYNDLNNRRRVSPFWPAGLIMFNSGTTPPVMRAYVATAEDNVFEVQANGTVAQAIVGDSINMLAADLSPPAGSLVTGLSSARADNTPVAGTVQGQLQVLGAGFEVDNALTDAFPILRVKISAPQTSAKWFGVG